MDLKILRDTPPWDWPSDAGKRFQEILSDRRANKSDRLMAAELAGDYTVINDELAASLMTIVRDPEEPPPLRAKAAIAVGAALEQADIEGFDDPDDVPITESTFRNIQDSFQKVYFDNTVPKEVRRRILEASVRAPQDWHKDAIGTAYSSGDKEWMLTAVFAMRWVRGFDEQVIAALKSADPDTHYEAVKAAGSWGLAGAWSHVVPLAQSARTPKPLRVAAIEAVGNIRPAEARTILEDVSHSRDEDIAGAAEEAITMAEAGSDLKDDEDDEDDEEVGSGWVN